MTQTISCIYIYIVKSHQVWNIYDTYIYPRTETLNAPLENRDEYSFWTKMPRITKQCLKPCTLQGFKTQNASAKRIFKTAKHVIYVCMYVNIYIYVYKYIYIYTTKMVYTRKCACDKQYSTHKCKYTYVYFLYIYIYIYIFRC